jgi:hypothetical protein
MLSFSQMTAPNVKDIAIIQPDDTVALTFTDDVIIKPYYTSMLHPLFHPLPGIFDVIYSVV